MLHYKPKYKSGDSISAHVFITHLERAINNLNLSTQNQIKLQLSEICRWCE